MSRSLGSGAEVFNVWYDRQHAADRSGSAEACMSIAVRVVLGQAMGAALAVIIFHYPAAMTCR